MVLLGSPNHVSQNVVRLGGFVLLHIACQRSPDNRLTIPQNASISIGCYLVSQLFPCHLVTFVKDTFDVGFSLIGCRENFTDGGIKQAGRGTQGR